jgi:prolyl 4-hydroxylase
MHSSSSSASSSAYSSKFPSFSSLVQYAFFAGVLYVLAGAPLQAVFRSDTNTFTRSGEGGMAQEKLESLVMPEKGLVCEEHAYKGVHVLSREPLVVYVEGFVSDGEARHVVGLR